MAFEGKKLSYEALSERANRLANALTDLGVQKGDMVAVLQVNCNEFVETYFAVGARSDFVVQLGYHYFFAAKLQGHDTAYSPDGDHVNPRNDYQYEDADEVINQPKSELLAMIGFHYRFGG